MTPNLRAARPLIMSTLLSVMPTLSFAGTWAANVQATDYDTTLDHRPNGSGVGGDVYWLSPSDIGFNAMERLVYNTEINRFQLKSQVGLTLNLQIWNTAHAMVYASAYYRDGVTVFRDPLGAQGGSIEFTWTIDGTEKTSIQSPGHGPYESGYLRYTELYAVSPGSDGSSTRTSLFESWEPTPDPAIYSDIYFPFPGPNGVGAHAGPHSFEKTKAVSQGTQTVTLSVPFASGVLLSVDFGLFTGITTSFYNVDYSGGIHAAFDNDFSNTSTLQQVRVLDENGSPLALDAFTLTSSNDYAYALNQSPVPEPSIWALWLAGLGVVALFARRSPRL